MWSPSLASFTTSVHQAAMVTSTPATPSASSHQVPLGRPNRPFIQITRPKARTTAAIEPISGQGLGFTRW